MPKLVIEIQMDNDAFVPYNGIESACILKTLARTLQDRQILSPDTDIPLQDINGNTVGFARVMED